MTVALALVHAVPRELHIPIALVRTADAPSLLLIPIRFGRQSLLNVGPTHEVLPYLIALSGG